MRCVFYIRQFLAGRKTERVKEWRNARKIAWNEHSDANHSRHHRNSSESIWFVNFLWLDDSQYQYINLVRCPFAIRFCIKTYSLVLFQVFNAMCLCLCLCLCLWDCNFVDCRWNIIQLLCFDIDGDLFSSSNLLFRFHFDDCFVVCVSVRVCVWICIRRRGQTYWRWRKLLAFLI